MRFIISQVLFILVVIITITNKSRAEYVHKERLRNLLYLIDKINNGHSINKVLDQMFEKLDRDCVKNFVSIPQADKLFINEHEEKIFAAAALLKCSDENITFNYYLRQFTWLRSKKLNCFEWKLQQLEPESPLIEDFSITKEEIEKCKARPIVLKDFLDRDINYLEILGPLDVLTCGAVTGVDDFFKFVSKGIVIKYGDITEELKNAEMEKLKKWFKDITFRTVDCFINRFDKDPKAYNGHDNFNHYFEQTINPISRQKMSEFPSMYQKLMKVQDAIDNTCTREKLNLSENGDLSLLQVEAEIVIGAAMSKCITIDNYDFVNLLLSYGISRYEKTNRNIYCSKLNLLILEPDSKLIKNFIINDDYECRNYQPIRISPFDNNIAIYKDSFGGELNNSSCGIISEDLENIYTYKALLVHVEKNKKLKKSESLALFDAVKDTMEKFADCIIQRVK